jgi:hypothetical protein
MKNLLYFLIILATAGCVSTVDSTSHPKDPKIQERVLLFDASGVATRMAVSVPKNSITKFTAILNKDIDFPQSSYKLEFLSSDSSAFTVQPDNCSIAKESSCFLTITAGSNTASANLSVSINDSTTPNKTTTKQIRVI